MRIRAGAVAAAVLLAVGLPAGCSPAERYDTLSIFFDGVPKPPPEEPTNGNGHGNGTGLLTGSKRTALAGVHGPYGARMCTACHADPATNRLVVPKEQLCVRCHELELDKEFVHGPLASGGCTVCHDPHSARYRHLLVADSATFCVRCHEPADIARNEAHRDPQKQCTSCHDAHQSNRRYLLK